MIKKTFIIAALALALGFAGCNNEPADNKAKDSAKETVGGTAIRPGDLMSENIDLGEMAVVEGKAPGTSEKVERSFENAPPMIPHSIEGLVPITIKSNMCLSCHMPAVAEAMKATPIPASHFTNYRPEIVKQGGKYHVKNNDGVTAKNLNDKLNSARYNCNQCHVALTNATVVIKNNFTPEFRDEQGKSKSNLDKTITEGVN